MSEIKPNIEKGPEDGRTGGFRRCQAKSSNFTRKKEKPVKIVEDNNNYVFEFVPQGQTELFANSLKYFYYIYGIKFQKNGSNVQYYVKNLSKPTLSAPKDPAFKEGKLALTMAQKGILDDKIKKFVDREEILDENLKKAFEILHGQCTEMILANMGGDSKYEPIDHHQDVIEIMKLIKGFMFKFEGNKELTHMIWKAYVSVF